MTDKPLSLVCLDGPEGCGGPVERRAPLSSTGRSHSRCERHWNERLKVQARINEDYPDSPVPPAWFDPAAAGETWDDE
jgi:hypothetical protein